jgi:hypothetical protein
MDGMPAASADLRYMDWASESQSVTVEFGATRYDFAPASPCTQISPFP